MCIKAIANFDYEAAKDNLVETVKYLDAGKILGVAGKLLEINPKDVVQKIKDKVTDEDTRLFVQSKVRLVGDILTWPMERQADRRVLARIMSYEYLWHNIREVGGAYGTGMLTRAQTEGLYTYRDPHLTESYETFAKAPEVLAGREYTEKDLTEFIVGAVSEMDSPKKPNAEAKELDRRYFCGITDAMLAADRKAMCSVTAETIRAQAADLADRMANATRVALGSTDGVEAGEQLGFLPGDLQQKVDPYLRPLYDGLFDMLGAETYERLVEKQIIEVAPLAYMRGRTLDDSFIILDEAQNTTPEQMKMFLTRMGVGSKVVVTGDVTQIDLPDRTRSGLVDALHILKNVDGIAQCYFTEKDVVRHRLVQEIIKAYEAAAHPAKR